MQFEPHDLDLDHVTFICTDPERRADRFCHRYGFRRVARASAGVMLRGGALVLVIRRARDEQEARWLATGGDRVVDVAFVLAAGGGASISLPDAGAHEDPRGSLSMHALPSPLPGLAHTLLDRSDYHPWLLPGFTPLADADWPDTAPFTHLDHLTLACEIDTLDACRNWYVTTLGFSPIAGMRADELTIETEHSGLRLQALELGAGGERRFKLTFVEPLAGRDAGQVRKFLDHAGGPGVQHLALATTDIAGAVAGCRARGVEFLTPPAGYYERLGPAEELQAIVPDYAALREAGVLLDIDRTPEHDACLMQIFSQPEFDRPTFFMELIARRESAGFGAGNVRALFRAIERAEQRERLAAARHEHTAIAAHDDGALEARLLELAGGPLAYAPPPERAAPQPAPHPVVIVGAGPVGLTLALALARAAIPVVVLDDDDRLPRGSRAVAWVKPTLEIWDRLGVGEAVRESGLAWGSSKMYFGAREVVAATMQPLPDQKVDEFAVNLQQYHVEALLLGRARAAGVELRFRSEVTGSRASDDGVILDVSTPDGPYALAARYAVDASGARSRLRGELAAETEFHRQRERFLIVDVAVDPSAALPLERRFWFDPPFHAGRTALMLPQPGHQLRLDFSLDADADADTEAAREALLDPAAVRARVEAMFAWLGFAFDFELVWSSVYGFSVGALPRAADGRVFFVGDALKSVSPFGARGGNGGIADVNNLAWKLARVIQGRSPERLLDTYAQEQRAVIEDHLRHIHDTADFMVPDDARACLRQAALELACVEPRARAYINSGRFCHPPRALSGAALTSDAQTGWTGGPGPEPGDYLVDGPLVREGDARTWLVDAIGGPSRSLTAFTLLVFPPPGEAGVALGELEHSPDELAVIVAADDPASSLRARYGAKRGGVYLIRPDGFVAARWTRWDPAGIERAMQRAIGRELGDGHDPPRASDRDRDRVYRAIYDGLAGLSAPQRERALARAVLALAQAIERPEDVERELRRALVEAEPWAGRAAP